MSFKYCVTITTRDYTYCNVTSKYSEFDTVKDLNSYLFNNICNCTSSDEIIGLYFEVINSKF